MKLEKEVIENRTLSKNKVNPVWVLNNIVKPVCRLDTFNSSLNKFKCTFGKGESDEHIDLKFKLWKQYRRQGFDVLTEVIFKNGSRADLLVINPNNGEVIIHEVINSEKELKSHKPEVYPFRIEIHKVGGIE
jgi:hypothetical protein